MNKFVFEWILKRLSQRELRTYGEKAPPPQYRRLGRIYAENAGRVIIRGLWPNKHNFYELLTFFTQIFDHQS